MKHPPKKSTPTKRKKEAFVTTQLYDYQKHDGKKTLGLKTGSAMCVNTTDWAIVDVDVKKKDAASQKINEFLSVLDKEKDVVVCTPSGGVHLYLYDDSEFTSRHVKAYTCEDFDVDLFFSKPKDKRSLIVLPGSKCENKEGVVKEYTYHPDFKRRFPKDFILTPHTKVSSFFSRFPFVAPTTPLTRRALTLLPSPSKLSLGLPPRKKSEEEKKSVRRRRSSVSQLETDQFKVFVEKTPIQEQVVALFSDLADIEIHADWNQDFEQEITLYHFFGVLNWLQSRSSTSLEDVLTPLLRFTKKATDQYQQRKERYSALKLSPQILSRCLHAIRHDPQKDEAFKEKLNALFLSLRTTDSFIYYSIQLDECFSYSDFLDRLGSTKSFNEALTLLSKVLRYIRFKGVYVIKKWNTTSKKYYYSVENEKQVNNDSKRQSYRTEWGAFRLSSLLERANTILYCGDYSLFVQRENCLCCFEGWAYEPKNYQNKLVEEFFRLAYVGLCRSDPEKFKFLVKWCANIVKKPGAKNGTIIVLSGPQGCGKTTFVNVFCKLLGFYAIENIDNVKHLTTKFNKAMVSRKVLVVVNEMSVVSDKDLGVLKTLCTEKTGVTEDKYERKELEENHLNIFITTNDIANFDFAEDERRFYIIEAGNYLAAHGEREHTEFFSRLYKGMDDSFFQVVLNILLNVDLSGFDPSISPHLKKKTQVSLSLPHVKEFYEAVLAKTDNEKELFFCDELYKLYCSFFQENEQPPEKNAFYKSEVASLFEKKRERFGGQRHYVYRVKKRKVSLRAERQPEPTSTPDNDPFFRGLFSKQIGARRESLDDSAPVLQG